MVVKVGKATPPGQPNVIANASASLASQRQADETLNSEWSWASVRAQRDAVMQATDWMEAAFAARIASGSLPSGKTALWGQLKALRTKLRDITDDYNDPAKVNFDTIDPRKVLTKTQIAQIVELRY